MKAKYALIVLLAVTFFGCDDNTAGLGLGMFPGSDQDINGKLTTYDVETKSVRTGDIYAKTNIGYVGQFTDKTFGTYDAGFLATLNCPKELTFPAIYETKMVDGKEKGTGTMITEESEDIKVITENGKAIGNIHAVEILLWYNTYFGDSVTPCRLSVYQLNKKLDKENAYYTNINPDNYYKKDNGEPFRLLGTKAYTAVDYSVKDSIRNLSTYVPSVHVNLEKSVAYQVGEEILKASRNAGSNFNNDIFSNIFNGLYVKSDLGDGTVLYVSQVQMNVVYKCYAVDENGVKLKKKTKKENETEYADSTYYDDRTFASTREVIQANQLKNDEAAIENCINNTPNSTYLKSPAGIFTQATLPVKEIANQLKGDTLNAVKLTFSNYSQSNNKAFEMDIPTNVMLIRKNEKDTFFKKNKLSDGISSFLTSHNSSTNQYTFSNITNLINACISERNAAEEKLKTGQIELKDENGNPVFVQKIDDWERLSGWNEVVLIPVLLTYDSSASTSSNPSVISIQHDLKPGYVRLKGGKNEDKTKNNYLKLEVISTSFTKK